MRGLGRHTARLARPELRHRTELPVGRHRLFEGVRPRTALHHGQRRVTEQALHVDFAGMRADRPCREGVAEAVRMHLLPAGLFPDPSEDRVQRASGFMPSPDVVDRNSGPGSEPRSAR